MELVGQAEIEPNLFLVYTLKVRLETRYVLLVLHRTLYDS